ncbi:uncharacterized protein CEXT_223331 [Caerostris extrusa]|uniref:Uncharacterized protein n=1 Tax=Caerostris extrusa TaxID=172846 RepID=A0AAV4YCP6_CAEEX|nr:uncharacterized protein CEXT_223331 [Caerostris extrusa]
MLFLLSGHGHGHGHHDHYGRSGNGIILPHNTFGTTYEKAFALPVARNNEPVLSLDSREMAHLEGIMKNYFGNANLPIGRSAGSQIPGGAFTGPAGEKLSATLTSAAKSS